MGQSFRLHRRITSYKALFSSIFIFLGAFTIAFCTSIIHNPVGESHAEAFPLAVDGKEQLTLTVSQDQLELYLRPSATGTTSTHSTKITSLTTAKTGHTLLFNSSSSTLKHTASSDQVTNLKHQANQPNEFDSNTWGLSTNGQPFKSTPTRPIILASTITPARSITTLTAGLKVNTSINPGNYTTTFYLTAITNQ